jgi:large subunit ribosomal protein L23
VIKFLTDNNIASKIIRQPIFNNKAILLLKQNKYCFIVHPKANKVVIKQSIESLFNVKVARINTLQLPKKKKGLGKFLGYTPQYKKAIITLVKENKINLFKYK